MHHLEGNFVTEFGDSVSARFSLKLIDTTDSLLKAKGSGNLVFAN